MRITFTGKQDKLAPSQERKLATAFARLSKLIERRGEKGAQVALSSERHRQMAEVRVNFYDQTLIGPEFHADQSAPVQYDCRAIRQSEGSRRIERRRKERMMLELGGICLGLVEQRFAEQRLAAAMPAQPEA